MKQALLFIDPMSYNNLELYDSALLTNSGNDFDIYFLCNKKFKQVSLPGVEIKKIFNYSDKKGIFKIISYLLSLTQILFNVQKYHPKVLHVQWFRIPIIEFYFYKIIKYLFYPIKLVHTAHNILPHDGANSEVNRYKKLYRLFDVIIIHTEASKSEIIELVQEDGAEKFMVIPHGLLEYGFSEDLVRKKFNEFMQNSKLQHRTILASLGFQGYYKGIDLLSEVWLNTPELRNNEDILFLIAGTGEIPNYEQLSKLDNTYIVNRFIDDLSFVAYLKLSDVVLLPYRKISQSGILLTALNLRRPVLVSDVGGLIEPLKFGKVGWSVLAGDKDSLRDKLIYLVKNIDEIKYVQDNTEVWDSVLINYDWKGIQKKTFNLYSNLLKFRIRK